MDESISNFSKTLASFCNHLQNSCDALKQSVDRRPIPLDSASSTFIQCLNRRVSTVSADLNLLESMSLGTVSFEELLGHFNEVHKKNESDLVELQKHLKGVGYVPETEYDDEDEIYNPASTSGLDVELSCTTDGSNLLSSYEGLISTTRSATDIFGEDILYPPPAAGYKLKLWTPVKDGNLSFLSFPRLDDSLSLRNAGLSDVCLATLASKGNCMSDDPYMDLHTPKKFLEKPLDSKFPCQSAAQNMGVSESRKFIDNESGEDEDNLLFEEVASSLIKLSKDDFESLPSYMKGLAPWEDLLAAVEKINSCLEAKEKGKNYIRQDEISSFDLGPNARSYLLLLVRLKRVVVETVDGQISYRVL